MTLRMIVIGALVHSWIGCHMGSPVIPPETGSDTTSHDFVFYVDVFGEGNGTNLRDVAIIDDTTAIAVGEVHQRDSTGDPGSVGANVVRWEHNHWILDTLYYNWQGTDFFSDIEAVWVFAPDNIWLTGGGGYHWDGKKYNQFEISNFPAHVGGMWGTGDDNLYMVGSSGLIAHYDGINWQVVQVPTTLDFQGIWGDKNLSTGKYEVCAVAGTQFSGKPGEVYRIDGITVTKIPSPEIPYTITSIWFKSQKEYYVVGGGMWMKENISQDVPWRQFGSSLTPYFLYAMKGQAANDIVAVGSYGEVVHFNGKTWRSYRDTPGFYPLELVSVDIKGNFLCAVGYTIEGRACAVRGYRK